MDGETNNLSRKYFPNSTSDAIKLLKKDTDFIDVIQYKDNQSRKQVNDIQNVQNFLEKIFENSILLTDALTEEDKYFASLATKFNFSDPNYKTTKTDELTQEDKYFNELTEEEKFDNRMILKFSMREKINFEWIVS